MGTAAILAGVDQVKKAAKHEDEGRSLGDLGRARNPPRRNNPQQLPVPQGMSLTVATVHTLPQRVKYIKQLIVKGRNHPAIRALAVKIVSKKCGKKFCIGERDYPKEVTAIFNWMRKNVRYVRDNIDRDTFQHPVRTIQFGGGDCDDYTITMAALLQAIGYPVKMRVIQTTDADDWNHIYLLVGIPPSDPQVWMPLDASVNKPAGWEPPASMIKRKKDFEVPI